MSAPLSEIIQLLAALGLANQTKNVLLPAPFNISAKVADYVIKPTQAIDPCGTLFTNRAAAGTVIFTLPAVTAVPAGTWYEFLGIAAQTITVATPAADTMVTVNDVAADTISMQTANQIIGARLKVVNDGTQWIASGETVGITYTVVTA